MSILIAEDNAAQRRYLSDLLKDKFPDRLPLIEAEDGESAVRLAIEQQPDLSILDIQMPKAFGGQGRQGDLARFPEALA